MKLYKISLRNLMRNKIRTFFGGLAIIVVTMGITMYFGFADGMMQDFARNVHNYVTGHFRIRHSDFDKNEQLNPLHLGIPDYKQVLEQVEKTKNVSAAAPRIQFGTMIFGSPRIGIQDIPDSSLLVKLLQDWKLPLVLKIRERLKPDTLALVDSSNGSPLNEDGLVTVLDDLNAVIQRYELHDSAILKDIALSNETQVFLQDEVSYRDRFEFNRLLLEDAFPEVLKKSPRLGKTFTGIGFGVDLEREKSFFDLEKQLKKGALPRAGQPVAELALTGGLAEKLNLTIGDKLTITTKTKYAGLNGMTFRVSGIIVFSVSSLNSSFFIMPLQTAQDFLKMSSDDSVTEIICKVKDTGKLNATIAAISDVFKQSGKTNLSVRSWATIGTYYAYVSLVDVAIAIMALFFLLAGSTVIIVTTIMIIFERMKEIGTIAAMGMTGREIVRLFFLESFFLSAIAAFIGVAIGVGITIPLSIYGIDFTTTMKDMNMEISNFVYPSLSPLKTIFVYFYSVAIASLSTFIPSRRAAKIQPVVALRSV